MRLKKPMEESFEIPLIPMIDCMLVIIIFFLVATTLKKTEKELPMELPQSAAAVDTDQTDNPLIIGVDLKGQKYFGTEPVTTDLLYQKLALAAQANPNQRVRVDADQAVPYAYVIELVELCQFQGLKNVGLHTAKTKK